MNSPAKRRKTNNHVDSKNVRSLDFFFGKQRSKESTESIAPAALQKTEDTQKPPKTGPRTDEELARQLQEEWNREDVPGNGTPERGESSKQGGKEEGFELPSIVEGSMQDTDSLALPKKSTLSLQSASAEEDTITYSMPFDQSPLAFQPSEYIPRLQQQWSLEGGTATYALLTRCFILINSTQSRIKIVDTLVNLLRVLIEGDPDSLLPAVCHPVL